MKIDGGCHCGGIAFAAEIDPDTVTVCHCADCQTLSGAPFRANVPAKAENFSITRGTPRIYVKTAQSGNRRAQGFCGDCGAPIYSTMADGPPAVYMLRVGVIAQRDQMIPKAQMWCSSAQSWAKDLDGLEGYNGQLPPK